MSIHDKDNELIFEAYSDPDSVVDPKTEDVPRKLKRDLDPEDVKKFDIEDFEYTIDDIQSGDKFSLLGTSDDFSEINYGPKGAIVLAVKDDYIIAQEVKDYMNKTEKVGEPFKVTIDEINESSLGEYFSENQQAYHSKKWDERRRERYVNLMQNKYR